MNVFDFAMEVERSGRQYYRKLAKSTDHTGVSRIYRMVADDEKELLEKFQAMKSSVQTTTLQESATLDGLSDRLKGILDENRAEGIESDLDAYNYVIEVEKDLCRLYDEAAERESDEAVRVLLQRISREERRELAQLEKIHEFVNAPNEFLAWGEFSNLDEFHNFGRDEG